MDAATCLQCLINTISRFLHLVSCQTIKTMPSLNDYKNIVSVLKLLKPLLDELVDFKIPSDDNLFGQCEQLDAAINEAREFLENWTPKKSSIWTVLQSEPLLLKIRSCTLEICHMLSGLLESSSSVSSLKAVEHCIQEINCLKQEGITEHIKAALRSQQDGNGTSTNHLLKVIESLNLTSNLLLKESMAVEKELLNAQLNKTKTEIFEINQIVQLISQIRDFMLKTENFGVTGGLLIPSYFRCPLSLKLMVDPVIVASGQTFERTSIQKWIDHGLTVCPKTRQTLMHTNVITNYTVKAMIANWCEENNIKFSNNSESTNFVSVSNQSDRVSQQGSILADSFRYSGDSTSRSSRDLGNGFGKQKKEESVNLNTEESNGFRNTEIENFDQSSPEQSYVHSRSESTSSAISSIDYLTPMINESTGIPKKQEIVSESSPSSHSQKESGYSPWLPVTVGVNGNQEYDKACSLSVSDAVSDDLTTTSHVKKLMEDLKSPSKEIQIKAAAELRLLGKHKTENRVIIGNSGAIPLLLSLLYSDIKLTQEHAVTALLNLSINDENKTMIGEAGAIEPLIHVLNTGNDGAKENSAATLFSLSVLEEYKAKIGRSGAVKALVNLLHGGTVRGKKDAATALFNLSIFHENKARIVQAGAVKYLVELMDPNTGMADKSVALLANLSTIGEGRLTIAREGGIPLLVEIVESGSHRGKENAASVLLQLCLNSPKFCTLVLQEGAVPPLVALSQTGTPRAKEKDELICCKNVDAIMDASQSNGIACCTAASKPFSESERSVEEEIIKEGFFS
ncbi:hypothetical protein ACFE04_031637 [Oxalis oulophora]